MYIYIAKSYTDVLSGTARCSEPTQPQIPNFIVSSQHTAWVLRTPVNGNNNFTLYILPYVPANLDILGIRFVSHEGALDPWGENSLSIIHGNQSNDAMDEI